MADSIGPGLREQWRRLAGLPAGKWLFSRVLGRHVPYTGNLGAVVRVLEPGHCVVELRERRRLRNHLDSIHAMALGNLAEMVTGLALLNSLPDDTRGILTGFSIDYLKKARGTLLAECRCEQPLDNSEAEHALTGEIRDRGGALVAVARARWLTGPERPA
ncbi:MAG: DUF4442 domain-containing protein [Gammaproteobacteria bacterium]|nr:DUF4442 domain-containing protein [Gammaproteobacteria bacterium]